MDAGTRKSESGTRAHPMHGRTAGGNVASSLGHMTHGDWRTVNAACRACGVTTGAPNTEAGRAYLATWGEAHQHTVPPQTRRPAHRTDTLEGVDHTEKPEPPVLIPQHGSTGGRKPYNVRLRMSLVAEAMNAPEFEGMSLAGIIEQVLEERLAQGRI
jgi:hypothetical protein